MPRFLDRIIFIDSSGQEQTVAGGSVSGTPGTLALRDNTGRFLVGDTSSSSTDGYVVVNKNYVDGRISSLTKSDTAVSGKYVSKVSESSGEIEVTRTDFPTATSSQLGVVQRNSTYAASGSDYGFIKTGYTNDTTNKNYAVKLNNNGDAYVNVSWITYGTTSGGGITKDANNNFKLTNTYAGGTRVTLNGVNKGSSSASFYAPTDSSLDGCVLTSKVNDAPLWVGLYRRTEKTIQQTSASGQIKDYNNYTESSLTITGGSLLTHIMMYGDISNSIIQISANTYVTFYGIVSNCTITLSSNSSCIFIGKILNGCHIDASSSNTYISNIIIGNKADGSDQCVVINNLLTGFSATNNSFSRSSSNFLIANNWDAANKQIVGINNSTQVSGSYITSTASVNSGGSQSF